MFSLCTYYCRKGTVCKCMRRQQAVQDETGSTLHFIAPQVCIKTFRRAASSALELSRWMRQVNAVHRLDGKRMSNL